MNTRVGHTDRDDIDVYVGRRKNGRESIKTARPGECWGNPYTLEDCSRGSSIRKFAALLETLLEERPVYRLHLRRLSGKTLGCWCREVGDSGPPCHGDVLAAQAERIHDEMIMGEGSPCERGEHWLCRYRTWRECANCGITSQALSDGGRAIDRTGADLWGGRA